MNEPDLDIAVIEAVLRDDAPEPDPVFARELDERVEAGFPRPSRKRAARRRWMPAVAAAATLLIAVAVAVSLSSSTSSTTQNFSAKVAPQKPAGEDARELGPFSNALSQGSPPATAVPPLHDQSRQVERSANLTLAVPGDEIQRAAGRVGTVAEGHGGYVLDSNVTTGKDGTPGGSFTLRVPTARLEATLAALSDLGEVTARSETSQDVTAQYRGTQDKLGNALLELRTLKERLKDAAAVERERIRAQMASVRADIRLLGGRMQQLRRRTEMSTVSLTLKEATGSGASKGQDDDSTGAAWRDAKHNLLVIANFLLRSLGVLLPLAVLGLIVALAARAILRRRREAALT